MANEEAVIVPAAEFARLRKLLDRQEIADCQARIARDKTSPSDLRPLKA